MDYKDYLEEVKKYLQKNTPSLTAYEDYYKKAIKNLGESYDASAERLEGEYASDANSAAAQSALNSKNIAQYMASRGLSRSGEAEQETINSNLSLNKTLSDLAKSKYNALSGLYADKNESLLALEKDYASKKSENDDWLYNAAVDLAAAELEADRREEDFAREDAKTAGEREYGEHIRKLEAKLKEEAAQSERAYRDSKTKEERGYNESREADERAYEEYLREAEKKYEAQLLAEKRAYEDKVREIEQANRLALEGKTADGGYTPSQTPTALAKSVISSYTADGRKISTIPDLIKVNDYLKELESGGVSENYIKELLVSLKAAGYKPPTQEHINAGKSVEGSADIYKSRRDSYYSMYTLLGFDQKKSSELAETAAINSRLDYCYTHSKSAKEFEYCCEILKISQETLDKYLARITYINSDEKRKGIGFNTAP